MKFNFFNGLLIAGTVVAAYVQLRALPGRRAQPPANAALAYHPVLLPAAEGPLRLAGAWRLEMKDRRFGGLSALAIDGGGLLAVSDLGAVVRLDAPSAPRPMALVSDLRLGPGPFGRKWGRDAESLARDPHGRGWWVGFEQIHSLWLYDDQLSRSLARIDLDRPDWRDNRGAEGLIVEQGKLLVLAENGRDAIRVGRAGSQGLKLDSNGDVADAATAPDGSSWVLLRSKGLNGIEQSIAPLLSTPTGYRTGLGWPVPKAAFDNYEGMAIAQLPRGGWRFWLITDDGHRFMARTLLVALDLRPSTARHNKSPARRAGPSNTI